MSTVRLAGEGVHTLPKSFQGLLAEMAVAEGMAMHIRCITIDLSEGF